MVGKPGKVGDPTDIYETPEDGGPIVADGGDTGRTSLHLVLRVIPSAKIRLRLIVPNQIG